MGLGRGEIMDWVAVGTLIAVSVGAFAAVWTAILQSRQTRAISREATLDIFAEAYGRGPWRWIILTIQAKETTLVLEAVSVPATAALIRPSHDGIDIRDIGKIRGITDFSGGGRSIAIHREIPAKWKAEVGFWYHRPTPSRLVRCISRRTSRSLVSLKLRWRDRANDTSVIEVAIHEIEKQMTVQK
jgi:hypothetical protein